MIRRIVPYTIPPLTLLATGLAGAPWLRAFPSAVMAAPLFGAVVVSTLLPLVTTSLATRRLWISALVDAGVFVAYELVAVLHSPAGISDLVDGLVHGPSQLLTFALPLVSPRTLLVAPIALCWLVGAVAGECLARGWSSVLPYTGWLISFGLAYAATERAAVADAQHARQNDTLLAVSLLVTLLLLRTAQTWVRQDLTAEATEAGGILPLRGLAVGSALTAAIALAAAATVQASAFSHRPAVPQRVPAVNQSRPITPLSFVAGIRPQDPNDPGRAVFSVTLDHPAPGYFAIASVDKYEGDGWWFTRTFRPSGGVVPADTNPALRSPGVPIVQRYDISAGPLTTEPWMPALYRPQQVTGLAVNVDADSGMVVPARPVRAGTSYTVTSSTPTVRWDQLPPSSLPSSASPDDTAVPGRLRATLTDLVASLSADLGMPATSPVPFLHAVLSSLHSRYHLQGVQPSASPSVAASASASTSTSASQSDAGRTGGVAFANVLSAIVDAPHVGTPEQYATLFALVARQVGVPARVVTGFRVASPDSSTLSPGTYHVTTAQAWTWVEIPMRHNGWVVVDPSPGSYSDSTDQQSVGAQPSPSSSAPPTQNALITKGSGGHAVAPKSAMPHHAPRSITPMITALLVTLGVLLVVVLIVLVLRKNRRLARRRRAPDPRLRLLGAWHESLDVLTESGLPELTRLTSTEVARTAGARFGAESATHVHHLGYAANVAMYSPATPIAPGDADAAWQRHRALRRLVRRQLGLRARVIARLRYHRARPSRGRVTGRSLRRTVRRH